MKINIFEGARRIALLLGGIAAAGTLIVLVTYDPYVSVHYSIARPNGAFMRMEETCPPGAARHFFSSKTSKGESVSVSLCLLTMSFGKDSARLIPYKTDEQGMIWGAGAYSDEVSEYARSLESRFKLAASDEELLKKEISKQYRENWASGLVYLVAGLVFFSGVVWAIGWIVRGFLGIKHGMDSRIE